MSMKAGGNRKPGGGSGSSSLAGGGAAAASGGGGAAAAAAAAGRQQQHNVGRGRHSGKGPSTVSFNGVYANMRMVHVLTSVVGSKCELKVKNGTVYEGVFKTYGPECDLVLDVAHKKSSEPSAGPRKEDIVESIIFKASDVVVVTFKDVDLNFARKVASDAALADNFTDAAVSGRINGEHKEKDLEPWDGGETHTSGDSLESLDTDVSNGWDPNDMFKYNEEKYGVLSTYDSSLSTYTVPLERDNSEEFLKREARAAQLAEEIEASATYKARVALENDERSEEDKFTAVVRGERGDRDTHTLSRENKYIPPSQRRDNMSWGVGRQNSPRLVQSSSGPQTPRPGPHDYSPSSGADQRVVNGGSSHWPSPCPSPSSRPPSRYQSGPSSLPPRAATPTKPPSRPPSRPSRPPSHPSYPSYPSSSSAAHHGPTSPASTLPKRMSSEGPPRMSPKSQRTPRAHRVPPCRTTGVPPGVDFISHNAPGEVPVNPPTRNSSSGGTWSSVVSGAHRPRSPRQNSMGGASPSASSIPPPQTGTAPVEVLTSPTSASSPTAASPNMVATSSVEAKECRIQETRQTSPTANKENVKPLDSSASITRPACKGPPSMAPDHRKQIDNLKKFSVDFRLQSSSNPDPVFDQMMTKPPRDPGDKPKDLPLDKGSAVGPEGAEEGVIAAVPAGAPTPAATPAAANGSKPGSPAAPSPSPAALDQKRPGPDVTSQGSQTTATPMFGGPKPAEDKDEKKEPVQDQVRKSTLNPNANEFKPRFNAQPKPANTPTPPRPQGQPSPSIVVQQPPTVYGQTVCFPQMYPLTPVSPGVQSPMYHVQMPHMTVSQSKPYRPGKVPNMPQQRSDQHHPQGAPTMMHPASAAGPPIVAQSPAYSTQYFTCSPQQFTSQQLVQQMPHYQSQAQHVFSPVMQGSRMMAPPQHGQPGLVSSSTQQYPEQTHTMYVSAGPMPQQYQHPSATLHPHPQHPQHPQPSATPTGQGQQGGPPQHGGPPNHPAQSPVQHQQHQQAAAAAAAAQALHMANQPPQQQMYSALAPTPPSMTPGPNPQSPQASFPSAQQTTVYIHPQQVQHGYNPNHMAHVQQAHMQSGLVQSHHAAPQHPPMMLMTTQGPPGGPQPPMQQTALNPIPVSSTTHFSYLAHPQVQAHHQQQL